MAATLFPLHFEHTSALIGQGAVIEISITGARVLASVDEGEVWLYGVNPSATAEVGSSVAEAREHFSRALQEILIHFMRESASFESFEATVQEFFSTTNADAEAEWLEARKRVRKTEERLEDLPVKPVAPLKISVRAIAKPEEVKTLTPALNEPKTDLATLPLAA